MPVSAPLVRLYSDYMHTEYRELDSDYVFVNLWSAPVGRPLRYQAVAKLVGRLQARTGIVFTPHMFRHTRATELIRGGVAIEVVSKLLTHRSVTTTSDAYVHLDVEDLRAELVRSAPGSPAGAELLSQSRRRPRRDVRGVVGRGPPGVPGPGRPGRS